jgi:hypothetical protein
MKRANFSSNEETLGDDITNLISLDLVISFDNAHGERTYDILCLEWIYESFVDFFDCVIEHRYARLDTLPIFNSADSIMLSDERHEVLVGNNHFSYNSSPNRT